MTNAVGYIYLLQSLKDQSYYFGSTNDINRRVREHNDGKSVSTRYKIPWQPIVVIRLQHISHARKMEQILKSYKQKITLSWFLESIAKIERNYDG